MVYFSDELELRGFERVIRGEVDVQEEHATCEGGVFRAHDGGLPVELIRLVLGAGGAVGRWVFAEVDEFLLDAFKGHFILIKVY